MTRMRAWIRRDNTKRFITWVLNNTNTVRPHSPLPPRFGEIPIFFFFFGRLHVTDIYYINKNMAGISFNSVYNVHVLRDLKMKKIYFDTNNTDGNSRIKWEKKSLYSSVFCSLFLSVVVVFLLCWPHSFFRFETAWEP